MSQTLSQALEARISSEVRALSELSLPGLRAEWRRRWGEPARFRSRDLLMRALAYRLQAEAFGGLATPVQKRVAELASRFARDRRYSPQPGPVLKPGSSLIREWRGVRHEVAITADGFTYAERSFTSLSKVAEHITGSKRSGQLFFGLKADQP